MFWNITPCSSLKGNRRFKGTCHLLLQDRKIRKQDTSVKAGGKPSNWLAETSDYIGSWREIEVDLSCYRLARWTELTAWL
jgi:hypothetical protein